MTDARLPALFATLDTPVDPPAAFAERLFEGLATDLGFRRGAARRDVRRRVLRALQFDPVPTGWTALRLAFIVATLALLLAATLLVVVGALLRREHMPVVRPTAAELVERSQAAAEHAPIVALEITGPRFLAGVRADTHGEYRAISDGGGTWRLEGSGGLWDPADGSFGLWRPGRSGVYDASSRTWSTTDADQLPLWMGGFVWRRFVDSDSSAPQSCPEPRLLADEIVAGRTSDHLVCASGLELWLDKETHLVLRYGAAAGPHAAPAQAVRDPFVEGLGAGFGMTVTALTLPAPLDKEAFSWSGPGGAHILSVTTIPTGGLLPSWSGSLASGGTLSSGALLGKVSVLWFWGPCSCDGPALTAVDAAAGAAADRVNIVTINEAGGPVEGTRELVRQLGISLPVVLDPDGSIGQTLGLDQYGYVVADASGRLLESRVDDLTKMDLQRILATYATAPGDGDQKRIGR